MRFLDELKDRLEAARVRSEEVTRRFQAAQAANQHANQHLQKTQGEYNAAMAEFNGWQVAVATETKREAEALKEKEVITVSVEAIKNPAPVTPIIADPATGTNKTELVRATIRQQPGGITPAEIWDKVKDQITNKTYLYAILGRLKDREEVSVRRGKYCFRLPKPEIVKSEDQAMQIQ
ncbi:MAG: hypothetical protein ABSB35_03130 [Bryobacteraceae bacterium]|jgi:hypothetical protein